MQSYVGHNGNGWKESKWLHCIYALKGAKQQTLILVNFSLKF